MEQLLAHLVGDYVLQSEWMAIKKTEKWWPAIVHGFVYAIPFLLITTSFWALAVIISTHIVIDRYRLAKILMWARNFLAPVGAQTERLSAFRKRTKTSNTPEFIFFWLMVIVDNTMHLSINFFAIKYLG